MFDYNSYFSDLYKELVGFRPSSDHIFYSMDDRDKDDYLKDMEDQSNKMAEIEVSKTNHANSSFEAQINIHERRGSTRLEAIKEILLATDGIYADDYQAPGYACYLLGLDFKYETEFAKALGQA